MSKKPIQGRGRLATVAAGILAAGIFAPAGTAADYAGWAVGKSWNDCGTILRTTDSGTSWMRQGEGQVSTASLAGVVAVDPYTAWVVGDSDGYATIYLTTDGGNTWTRKGSPTDLPDLDLGKVDAPDRDHVWAVGQGAILHSADGGASWINQMPAEYEDILLQGVSAPDVDTVWVTGGKQDGYPLLLKSVDEGGTWTRQSGGDVARPGYDHILGISAVDGETAWAIGGDSTSAGWFVLKTSDGGATWIFQTGGAHDGNNVCAVSASTVWTASDSAICRSTDGGEHWEVHNSHEYTMGISAVSEREAWAVTYYILDGEIWHTDDGGTSWGLLTELGGERLPPLWTVSFSPQPVPPRTGTASGDYDGDGVSDLAVFRPETALWVVRGLGRLYFGKAGDIPVSGDYDGDGLTDPSIYRPYAGLWVIKGLTRFYLGGTGAFPAPADYDGDGTCNPAAFTPSSGLWVVRGLTRAWLGRDEDVPVPADYDGDGVAEIAFFRETTGLWNVRGLTRFHFGREGDIPVPGAYAWNIPPAAVPAVFRPGQGLWIFRGLTRHYFGRPGDLPLRGSFAAGILEQPAFFRPAEALWKIRGTSRAYLGRDGDIPISR